MKNYTTNYWNLVAHKFINSRYKDNEVDKFLIECCNIKPKKSILKRSKKWIEYRHIILNT